MATRDSGFIPAPAYERHRLPAESGDRRALDELFSAAYEELRRLAASVRRNDPGATLSPTALVNEAWLKLARLAGRRPHIAAAFQADRRACDAAGARRGGAPAPRRQARRWRAVVTFDESLH